jgi:hypothetical protein
MNEKVVLHWIDRFWLCSLKLLISFYFFFIFQFLFPLIINVAIKSIQLSNCIPTHPKEFFLLIPNVILIMHGVCVLQVQIVTRSWQYFASRYHIAGDVVIVTTTDIIEIDFTATTCCNQLLTLSIEWRWWTETKIKVHTKWIWCDDSLDISMKKLYLLCF